MRTLAFVIASMLILGCRRTEIKQSTPIIPHPPVLTSKFEHAPFQLPDSLGGSHIHGLIYVTTDFTIGGRLVGFKVDKIKIAQQGSDPKTIYSVFDNVTSPEAEQQKVRFVPWVEAYLKESVITFSNHPSKSLAKTEDTVLVGVTIRLPSDSDKTNLLDY